MTGDEILVEHHILRYVKGSSILEDNSINGSEFRLRPNRPDETGVSVDWIEYYSDRPRAEAIEEIRRVFRLRRTNTARFAELNVGTIYAHIRTYCESLSVIHKPVEANEDFPANPSHAEITGLPSGSPELAELVGDMIAECVLETLHDPFNRSD